MISYQPQSMNPKRISSMPVEWPWIVRHGVVDGWITISKEEFDAKFSGSLPEVDKEMAVLREYEIMRKRSEVKDSLLEYVAASNKARMVNGVWTSADIISLSEDTELLKIVGDIQSLSFEIAIMKIQAATNPLITDDIKEDWIIKVQENLFME